MKKLAEKNPLIKRLVNVYKKYIEPHEAMVELMNERDLFWHPGTEYQSGLTQMSGFMFSMRDERDELDDEMCEAHYREMLLMDLAFNRHKRDYLAKWNSNRENWLKLVLGLEAQNVRVRTVVQEGSIIHGDISWTFVDLDKKRRARQDAHYKGKVLSSRCKGGCRRNQETSADAKGCEKETS